MAGNSGRVHGGRQRVETPAQEMAAFDALPAELRRELANCHLEWPAADVWRAHHLQRLSVPKIIGSLRQYEKRAS